LLGKKDILNTSVSRQAVFELKVAEIDDEGLAHGIDYDPFMIVQPDPNDALTMVSKNNNKNSYHMHPALWLNTLDEYINQYYRLSELLDSRQDELERMEISLQDNVPEMQCYPKIWFSAFDRPGG
jgi:hypothetical protein